MKVQCPHCGRMVAVNSLGRKVFNMPGNKVYDTLQVHCSVRAVVKP